MRRYIFPVLRGGLAVAALTAAFFVPCAYWDVALPKDNGQWEHVSPELREWFRSVKNKNGVLCCSEADGKQLGDEEWRITATGRFEIRFEDRWFLVPDDAVITNQQNKLGGALVWINNGRITCFFPGALG